MFSVLQDTQSCILQNLLSAIVIADGEGVTMVLSKLVLDSV